MKGKKIEEKRKEGNLRDSNARRSSLIMVQHDHKMLMYDVMVHFNILVLMVKC